MEEQATAPLVLTAYGLKPMKRIMDELKAPFYWADLDWRVGSTNKEKTEGWALPYITNRAVQDRLDEVMGMGFWRNEKYEPFRTTGVLAGISLLIDGQWITKWDGADQTDVEATKGGFSSAMKRAAAQWGIGRYIYHLPQFWVALEQRGRSTVIKGEPPLHRFPIEALPADDPARARKTSGQGANQDRRLAQGAPAGQPDAKPTQAPTAPNLDKPLGPPIIRPTDGQITLMLEERRKRVGGWEPIVEQLKLNSVDPEQIQAVRTMKGDEVMEFFKAHLTNPQVTVIINNLKTRDIRFEASKQSDAGAPVS
jgi:hypothetical protein